MFFSPDRSFPCSSPVHVPSSSCVFLNRSFFLVDLCFLSFSGFLVFFLLLHPPVLRALRFFLEISAHFLPLFLYRLRRLTTTPIVPRHRIFFDLDFFAPCYFQFSPAITPLCLVYSTNFISVVPNYPFFPHFTLSVQIWSMRPYCAFLAAIPFCHSIF